MGVGRAELWGVSKQPKIPPGGGFGRVFLGRLFFYCIFVFMRNKAVLDPGLRKPHRPVCMHSHFSPTRRGMSPPKLACSAIF